MIDNFELDYILENYEDNDLDIEIKTELKQKIRVKRPSEMRESVKQNGEI